MFVGVWGVVYVWYMWQVSEVTDLLEMEFRVSVSLLMPGLGVKSGPLGEQTLYSALNCPTSPLITAFVERPLKLL